MPTVPSIGIAEVPGKGKGVVAKEHISRSTLIISEKPRITMPIDNFGIVKALHSMSEKDVAFFMSFPGSDDDPIKGRLKHFIPCEGDNCFGLCETICRVNHVCYSPMGGPNAAYYWNTSSKEEELHALKEIQAGQEIEVSYMADIEQCEDPPMYIREKFGFECSCKGCARPAAERQVSNQRIRAYNVFISSLPAHIGRTDPLQILKDIERQIVIVCAEEGYTNQIGGCVDEAFQLCAYYGDADSMHKWLAMSRDFYALYHGPTSETCKGAQRLLAAPQTVSGWKRFGTRKLKGPSKKVLECWYKDETSVLSKAPSSVVIPGPARASFTSGLHDASASVQNRSKSQKKKAKAKAKKAAAKSAEDS
ncbi:hypothetical protein B0H13DRAFT_2662216 [Mycena leptocephala]|nr:hypothetical protein B0H13DRAFT_2662216 [Mycena leptocephala]